MKDFLALTKPRVTLLAALTAMAGYFFSGSGSGAALWWMAAGTALVSGATGCLNQYLEREEDGLMKRTRHRPLPAGRIKPAHALGFGVALAFLGSAILWWKVNLLACALADFTLAGYLWGYTPLKKKSPLALWVGAIPGAMPPLIGWAAARNELGWGAWCLFAIQFLWQIPHFLALAWMYREDYASAGFRVTGWDDPSGKSVLNQMIWASWGLLAVSIMPVWAGERSWWYFASVGLLGIGIIRVVHRARSTLSFPNVRRVFRASLVYLPMVYLILSVDR